jgi:N-methylhydantoinase B
VQGGCPSPASRTFVVRDGHPIRVKPHRMVEIKTGDILAKISGGGGGVGHPFERPPELVALDVKNEMVSVEAARKVYGVAVDPVTFAIDEPETRRLRSALSQAWDVVIDEQQLTVDLALHKA